MTILDVQEGESNEFAHLALKGELDLSTVPKVEEALSASRGRARR